jgi:hypothetical protein
MHIQDGRMHAAFVQNNSIYFEKQARYGIIVKEVYIYIPLIGQNNQNIWFY